MVSIILTSKAISFPLLSLKIDSLCLKKISVTLYDNPPTLNDYLTTYIQEKPHNNTEAASSPAVAATG